jgi:hypothetical protein
MTAKNAISSVIIISAATTINSLALSGDYWERYTAEDSGYVNPYFNDVVPSS